MCRGSDSRCNEQLKCRRSYSVSSACVPMHCALVPPQRRTIEPMSPITHCVSGAVNGTSDKANGHAGHLHGEIQLVHGA